MSMTNSEQPSSPEEKWTAYFDGKLSIQDAATFEREHPEAISECEMHARFVRAVRLHLPAPKLRNADFFNTRILREIAPSPAPARRLWPLWRIAAASVCCLFAVFAVHVFFVHGSAGKQGNYFVQVVSVKAGDESLDATVLDAEGLAVVWIDGMEQLPSEYELE
jgi:hypothetical protein